jgi:hypothetical protein
MVASRCILFYRSRDSVGNKEEQVDEGKKSSATDDGTGAYRVWQPAVASPIEYLSRMYALCILALHGHRWW